MRVSSYRWTRSYKSKIDRLLEKGLDKDVVTAYTSGEKVVVIAKKLRVSRDVIYRILRQNGVRPYHHDNSRDKNLDQKKEHIIDLYHQGFKPKEIMSRLGMKNPKLIYETLKAIPYSQRSAQEPFPAADDTAAIF